jgi:hypothetical protein
MSSHPSDLNVTGENSVAPGSYSDRNREESEPAAFGEDTILTSHIQHTS